MTNCSDMRPHLAIYADGELAAELYPAVEAHLAECQKCRTEVEHWQALRRCAQRVVASEALPAGLEQRLRQRLHTQSRTTRHRLIKFMVPGLAAAAVIVVAVSLYLPGVVQGAAVDVSAEDFARAYRGCAVAKHHDSHNCRGMSARDAREFLASELGFKPLVADLSAHGYVLGGACECFPVREVRVIHVHYLSQAAEPQVVSLFSADHRLRLTAGSRFRSEGDPGYPDRSYEVAQAGQVNVLKWDEQRVSFALCSQMEQEQLLELAGSVDFARFLRQLPAYARIPDR